LRDRLALKAIAARARAEKPPERTTLDGDRVLIEALVANAEACRAQTDLLVLYAEPVLKYLATDAVARRMLALKWESALDKALNGKQLTRADQIDALDARVVLSKFIDRTDKLSSQRAHAISSEVHRIVAQTNDRYERQAVVPAAAHVLTAAGLEDESDALLKAELSRAVAPYYHMLGLAGNAKERGDKADALNWYEQAWRKSVGPATRLQWGTGYVRSVIQLTPEDSARIAKSARAVIAELEPRSETFFERNQRSLKRMTAQLMQWQGDDPARAKVVGSLRKQLAGTCAKLPTKDRGRLNCERVFNTNES